jgi:hypothetical protein
MSRQAVKGERRGRQSCLADGLSSPQPGLAAPHRYPGLVRFLGAQKRKADIRSSETRSFALTCVFPKLTGLGFDVLSCIDSYNPAPPVADLTPDSFDSHIPQGQGKALPG